MPAPPGGARAFYLRLARLHVRKARDERDLPRTMSMETRDLVVARTQRRVQDHLVLAREFRDRARRAT